MFVEFVVIKCRWVAVNGSWERKLKITVKGWG